MQKVRMLLESLQHSSTQITIDWRKRYKIFNLSYQFQHFQRRRKNIRNVHITLATP